MRERLGVSQGQTRMSYRRGTGGSGKSIAVRRNQCPTPPTQVCEFQSARRTLTTVGIPALYCAHRTSTVSPCAFCEQRGHLPLSPHPFLIFSPLQPRGDRRPWQGTHVCPNCGRRTRPFLGRAFREHGSNVGVLPLSHSCISILPPRTITVPV